MRGSHCSRGHVRWAPSIRKAVVTVVAEAIITVVAEAIIIAVDVVDGNLREGIYRCCRPAALLRVSEPTCKELRPARDGAVLISIGIAVTGSKARRVIPFCSDSRPHHAHHRPHRSDVNH